MSTTVTKTTIYRQVSTILTDLLKNADLKTLQQFSSLNYYITAKLISSCSRSSKVTDFDSNWKRVCNFLL